MHLIISKAMSWKLGVHKISLTQDRQSFVPKPLLLVALYNSVILYDNLVTLNDFVFLNDNLVALYNRVN